MARGHTPSPVYRRHSGYRRHSNQKHSSKELKHAIAQANYVPVSGVAVGPIKLITLAIVENCVIKCVSKEPYSVSPKALYCRKKKAKLHARTHNFIPYLDRFFHRKTCLNNSKY
jgi:hypothetical protein